MKVITFTLLLITSTLTFAAPTKIATICNQLQHATELQIEAFNDTNANKMVVGDSAFVMNTSKSGDDYLIGLVTGDESCHNMLVGLITPNKSFAVSLSKADEVKFEGTLLKVLLMEGKFVMIYIKASKQTLVN